MTSLSLVDTHAHLDMINKDKEVISEVLERADKEGVRSVITVGIDLDSSRRSVDFSETFPNVFASVGIHPNDADSFSLDALETLKELAAHHKVKAWGEIGLDFYRKHTSPHVQMEALEAQLDAATSRGLPVIIHARDAVDECIDVIQRFANTSEIAGVFHCFSGGKSAAKRVLDLGFYISFTGVITFPKAESVRDVARFVPMDKLLLETDAPFLSPVPFRGKPNEPSRVRYVAETVSQIKKMDFSEVARCTTENAVALFKLSVQ